MAIASVAEVDRSPRLAVIDVVRGIAIVLMAVYHFAFDLSSRQMIPVDVTRDPLWVVFARTIASTFLLLVGIGLVLATRRGFNRAAFLRRLAFVAGGAVLVTIATWWMDPETFVFFGILHQIAVASVLALPFLGLPVAAVAVAAAAVIALPFFYASPLFDTPLLWWVGFSTVPPDTVDYVPIFPWFGVVLAGIVVGRLVVVPLGAGALGRWRAADPVSRALAFAGRWSLAIYLIHQPILVGAVSLADALLPPNETAVRTNFTGQCTASCVGNGRDTNTCEAFCGCMFTRLYGTDLMSVQSIELMQPEQRTRWNGIVSACLPPKAPAK